MVNSMLMVGSSTLIVSGFRVLRIGNGVADLKTFQPMMAMISPDLTEF
jgi:hypothetical protein